jgi:hypothetical protein
MIKFKRQIISVKHSVKFYQNKILPNNCVAHGRSDALFPKVGAIKNSREYGLTD